MVQHVDVLVVGAGLSGVGAGHYLESQCPWASYAILEARDAIGGTWDLFRYPGVRSDSDMFTLGYSFRPWDGDTSIAEGASILRYIRDVAASEGIEKKIRFHHRVVRADWSSTAGLWCVTALRTDTGETVKFSSRFLFSCSGYYRYDHGHLPEFSDMEQFEGTLVHPQAWPENLDYAGKRVVVIGSGATAVTLVPAIADTARHVVMLQRSPSYIASIPMRNPVLALLRKVTSRRKASAIMRWFLAIATQIFYQLSQRRPVLVKRMLRRALERQLPLGYDIDTHFTPHYNPWDQRLCATPDGDFFKALCAGTVSVVTDQITAFTKTGLRLASGAELPADVIVTATGLEMLFMGGIELSLDGKNVDVSRLLVYKGMMLEGIPNLAWAFGYTNASWTLKCELTCAYVCRLLNYMRESGFRQCAPRSRGATISVQPMVSLSSGYVRRALDRFPKQGSRFPWQVHQSYLHDYWELKVRGIEDQTMVFSSPGQNGMVAAA